jgi:hypothetical protein
MKRFYYYYRYKYAFGRRQTTATVRLHRDSGCNMLLLHHLLVRLSRKKNAEAEITGKSKIVPELESTTDFTHTEEADVTHTDEDSVC